MRRKHNIDDILDSGIDLFRRQGFNNTGVEDILRAGGIPKGSFYNFFKSKEDFGLQVMQRYADIYDAYVAGKLRDKSRTPLNRLKHFYESLINGNESEGCRYGCLINNLTQEIAGNNDAVALALRQHFERIVAIIAECIAEGQKQGEISRAYPAPELADYLHTSFYGALVRMKGLRSSQPLQHFLQVSMNILSVS